MLIPGDLMDSNGIIYRWFIEYQRVMKKSMMIYIHDDFYGDFMDSNDL